ncbi:sigma 54-interacting transcriptional regulator [uncultured Cohaesibacter sp.]|uniref:sigma-54-dependent Fis family transcriptional regulator n=1 Tax=uncultured Cohaesibacter sp. TaxID=1002546 RepID=UPI0029C7F57F|nr:sigma 54-interacting transcriptional regulator [uncultured Cohaesibacter sp.]
MVTTQLYRDLVELTIALANEQQVETLMERVLDAALSLSNAEGAAIYTLDGLARHLHCVSLKFLGRGERARKDLRISLYNKKQKPILEDPAAFAAITGKIVNIGKLDEYTGYDLENVRTLDAALEFKTRSLLIAPLVIRSEQVIGILQLSNARSHADKSLVPFDDTFTRPLQSFAAHAAVAIHNARLYEENHRLIRKLGAQNERLIIENTRLISQVQRKVKKPEDIIGDSPPMARAYSLVDKAACSSVPILIRGETGTGKEKMANFIRTSSDRADKPIVVQNCAALPEALLESELFGHVRGAFTGATADKKGLAHEAHQGTLFLDEIGDMPLSLQAKVLRLLQEGELRRVGSTKPEFVDVRIIAATNVDLEDKIEKGEFRRDLYYRLNVFPIILPPLRERMSDIPKLIDHFLQSAASSINIEPPLISPQALDCLLKWSYPGNVRELKNILERAVLLARDAGTIETDHLPIELSGYSDRDEDEISAVIPEGDLKTIIGQYEARVLEIKLRELNWNQSKLARELNVSRRTIVEKINRYDIRRPGQKAS